MTLAAHMGGLFLCPFKLYMELLHQAVVDVVEVVALDAAEVIRFYAAGLVGDAAGIMDGVGYSKCSLSIIALW